MPAANAQPAIPYRAAPAAPCRDCLDAPCHSENAQTKHPDRPDGRRGRKNARRICMKKIIAVETSGACMRPTIKSGDVVIVETGKKPRAGDCVLFESDGRRFLHRALYASSDGALLADDAGFTPAVFVPKDSFVGVCRIFPSGAAGAAFSFFSRAFFRLGRAFKHILK